MSVKLNHTIVAARNKGESAAFLAELLGLPTPSPFGPFLTAQLGNDVTLDFYSADRQIAPQHYAFLVSETEFDEILGRIRGRGLPFWADPHHHRANEINTRDGGARRLLRGPEWT
jgi:hypothetical protein